MLSCTCHYCTIGVLAASPTNLEAAMLPPNQWLCALEFAWWIPLGKIDFTLAIIYSKPIEVRRKLTVIDPSAHKIQVALKNLYIPSLFH